MSAMGRVLIANRGEIACRIIDSCQRMGLIAIAVYAEPDRHARHVRLADQALGIGPALARDSYLNIDAIIQAARDSQADAIHPGYGFLAENADFAQAVIDAGLVFIGPHPETIRTMGSKAKAKALLGPEGVPLIPGFHGDASSDEALIDAAQALGMPLMVKAAAGGGGKGMRIVKDPEEIADHLQAARREAQAAFGDDRLILERYLNRPRHIEAQILGDMHGRVIHLYERDCSSQRRHQKVIEEAPASRLDPNLRQALLDAAVQAGQAVGYVGAGTVEFLVDEDSASFYFLEMNTRLQVEHPVTELITGFDLVEWQLKIATGEALPAQETVLPPTGHAFEARVYAEDPARGFLPATGTIRAVHWPADVRIDSGIDAGDAVGIDYDPLLAKVIVHGPDRASALEKLQRALATCWIDGVTTNLGFLSGLAADPMMVAGTVDTGHLDRALANQLAPDARLDNTAAMIGASLWAQYEQRRLHQRLGANPWAASTGWRASLPSMGQTWWVASLDQPDQPPTAIALLDHGQGARVERDSDQSDGHEAGRVYPIEWHALHWTESSYHTLVEISLSIDHHTIDAMAHLHPRGHVEWVSGGQRYRVAIQQQWLGREDQIEATGAITAPMPGQVTALHARVGQTVQTGELLALMEAMKMELSIRAPIDGTVAAVHVRVADRVDAAAALINIDPADNDS